MYKGCFSPEDQMFRKFYSYNPGQNSWGTDAKMTHLSFSTPSPASNVAQTVVFKINIAWRGGGGGGGGTTKIVCHVNTPELYKLRLPLCVMKPVFSKCPKAFILASVV